MINNKLQPFGEILRFPDEGHGIRKMNNRITAYMRVAEFLEENLKQPLP